MQHKYTNTSGIHIIYEIKSLVFLPGKKKSYFLTLLHHDLSDLLTLLEKIIEKNICLWNG